MANNIELIRQALSAAESSIRLSKQLLADLEKGTSAKAAKGILPGTIGAFDGENMVMESGEKHPVPANYASKSMLVVGDTLKLVEERGEKRFKQIEHVKRYKTKGVLTKKDGKYHVVTPEGSYRVLSAAAAHFGVSMGEEVVLILPAKNLNAAWGTIESVTEETGEEVSDKEKNKEKIIEEKAAVEDKSKKKKEEEAKVKIEKKEIKKATKPPTIKAEKKEKEEEKKQETKKPQAQAEVGEEELR